MLKSICKGKSARLGVELVDMIQNIMKKSNDWDPRLTINVQVQCLSIISDLIFEKEMDFEVTSSFNMFSVDSHLMKTLRSSLFLENSSRFGMKEYMRFLCLSRAILFEVELDKRKYSMLQPNT